MDNISNSKFFKDFKTTMDRLRSDERVVGDISIYANNLVINNFDYFWAKYEEGISNIKDSNFNLKDYLQDILILLSFEDHFLNDIIDKTIDYISEVYQGFSGFPNICLFVSPKNFKNRYRIFLEKIYYDLFHEDKELYDPSVIKYLFDEEKTLIK